ncbi:MAG: toll/interleukin-1 receptor domain-containing protein [Bacteroidetes bacterium]|nr:toll/interleukin-1 receptor domain-containing protein [Bacteroidota bacterium]
MSFKYSGFISYRHNDSDNTFFVNLKNFISSEIFKVTNKPKSFYDAESIDWGVNWDDKIYNGIGESFFFIPVWYYHYLNEANLWCARELYHALQVEQIIKSNLSAQDSKEFFFIFPLIYRGNTDLIPECFSKKSAKSLRNFETDILNKKITTRLNNFSNDIYDTLMKHFLILDKYPAVDFQAMFNAIPRPTDAEIIDWIREQKKQINEKEAKLLPVLVKNGE